MSELPRTDELPRSEDGYDAARVEEAFASFAERVHELEAVAVELRAELRALRAEREHQRFGPERGSARYEDEDWPADARLQGGLAPSPDWIGSVPAPLTRPVTIPRLALEAIFLILVALCAGLADLTTNAIVIVMAAAWFLVALSEWSAAAKRSRWRLDAVASPVEATDGAASDSTGPWSIPVVEATVVEAPVDSESHTVVTKLPPQPEVEPEPAQPEAAQEPEQAAAQPDAAQAEAARAEAARAEAAQLEDTGESPAAEPPAAEPSAADGELPVPDADAEPAPKRRRGFFRRRRLDDEPAGDAPDPWET